MLFYIVCSICKTCITVVGVLQNLPSAFRGKYVMKPLITHILQTYNKYKVFKVDHSIHTCKQWS